MFGPPEPADRLWYDVEKNEWTCVRTIVQMGLVNGVCVGGMRQMYVVCNCWYCVSVPSFTGYAHTLHPHTGCGERGKHSRDNIFARLVDWGRLRDLCWQAPTAAGCSD